MGQKILKIKRAILLFVLIHTIQPVIAQYDPMFTQYMFNEMFINPAYAGARDAISVNALYRNQWVGIDGAPTTQTFSAHAPVNQKKMGVGIGVLNEKIGVSHRTAFSGNYAYRIETGKGYLSMGLQGTLITYQERYNELQLTNTNDQKFGSTTQKVIAPNAGLGIYYYQTNKFYIGVSIPRLIVNDLYLENGKAKSKNLTKTEDFHYYTNAGYVIPIQEDIKLKPSIMLKAVKGAPLEADLDVQLWLKDKIWLGCTYRTAADISALIGLQITPQFHVGYSYDYSTTALQKYNSGSHEITIGYDFNYKSRRVTSIRYF